MSPVPYGSLGPKPTPRRWFYGRCEQCLEKGEVTLTTDGRYGDRGENDLAVCRRCFRGK